MSDGRSCVERRGPAKELGENGDRIYQAGRSVVPNLIPLFAHDKPGNWVVPKAQEDGQQGWTTS